MRGMIVHKQENMKSMKNACAFTDTDDDSLLWLYACACRNNFGNFSSDICNS